MPNIMAITKRTGGISQATADTRYLKLDQTTAQSVINGLPIFTLGMAIGNATSYILVNGNSREVWVNGALRQVWTTIPVTTITTGSPVPLGYLLTYP